MMKIYVYFLHVKVVEKGKVFLVDQLTFHDSLI